MAIYHFSGTIISRKKGQSSVSASAYRAAEKTHDKRTEPPIISLNLNQT